MKNSSVGPIDRVVMVFTFVVHVCSSMLKKYFANSQACLVKSWTGARLRHGKASCTYPLGYAKPLGGAKKIQIHKGPEAKQIVREVFRHAENGMNYSEMANLLNKNR